MEYERNLDYFNRRQIIYRRDPVNDKPTETHSWGYYYESGTYECYTLFNSRAKINTYKSLRWHLYVLWYLNPKVDPDEFLGMCKYLCHKPNGFVTFTISESAMQNINYEVSMSDLERQPPNKLRKVIFKEYTGLDMRQKLSIVGQMVGRKKLSESEIYDAMLIMYDEKEKINISKLAIILSCSTRTIYRNMSNELKKEKELLNQQL
tara:strand:- start:914 stop:1531 length:618 start_codon:yes stop_codon:yes gene_type:complete